MIPLDTTTIDISSSISAMMDAVMSTVSSNLPIILGVVGAFLAISIVIGFATRLPKRVAK